MNNIYINGTGLVPSGEYKSIIVCGSGFSSNHFECDKIEINGVMVADNNIRCNDTLEVNGEIIAKKVKAKTVIINGTIKCDELSADNIIMKLTGKSDIIKIDTIDLKVNFKNNFFTKHRHYLKTSEVNCEAAKVEFLHTEMLKCNVLIGSVGTVINNLYYKDNYTLHDKATANNIYQL